MRVELASLLWDVQNAGVLVGEFLEGVSRSEYARNPMVRSAVERQLQIVGEALTGLRKSDSALATQIPDVHRIIGLRNVLVHGYAVVDDDVVYAAATARVPELLAAVRSLLDS